MEGWDGGKTLRAWRVSIRAGLMERPDPHRGPDYRLTKYNILKGFFPPPLVVSDVLSPTEALASTATHTRGKL